MAFAAQYAHPVEHILVNVATVFLPLLFRGAHIVTFCIYLGSALVETAATHSGYDFFRPSLKANMHDLHDEKFNVNFGGLWMLDYLHGTYDMNRQKEKKVD